MNESETISLLAIDVWPGEHIRAVCPFCQAKHERSFRIERRADKPYRLSFRCFRGHCGVSGYLDESASAAKSFLTVSREADNMPRVDTPRISQEGRHAPVSPDTLELLAERYDIDYDALYRYGIRESTAKGYKQVYFPVYDQHGKVSAYNEKRIDRKVNNLLIEPWAEPSKVIAWHRPSHQRRTLAGPVSELCILVEDQLSQIKVNSHRPEWRPTDSFLGIGEEDDFVAIALLGCTLNYSAVPQLTSRFNRFVVLLDPDVWPKAHLDVIEKLKVFPVDARAVYLPQDPKDTPTYQLQELLEKLLSA